MREGWVWGWERGLCPVARTASPRKPKPSTGFISSSRLLHQEAKPRAAGPPWGYVNRCVARLSHCESSVGKRELLSGVLSEATPLRWVLYCRERSTKDLPERERPLRMASSTEALGRALLREYLTQVPSQKLGLLPASLPTTNTVHKNSDRLKCHPSSPESAPRSSPLTSPFSPPRSFSNHAPLCALAAPRPASAFGARPSASASPLASLPLAEPLQTCLYFASRDVFPEQNLYPVTSLLKTFRGSLLPGR